MANLLIIDDDSDILRLLEFTLKRAGHQVTTCADGLKGLAQAEIQKPDLIICDVMMPKMTGYEFCRQIRARPELSQTPIVVYSARFQPIDKKTALEAGATEYLPKSISPDDLISRITTLLPATSTAIAQGTVGLFSFKGGVGVTSLAVNLAIALTAAHKAKTSLVDFAPHGGHTALMLGLRPNPKVVELLYSAEADLAPQLIQSCLLSHHSGIQILTFPPTIDPALSLSKDHMAPLIKTLASTFTFTVLDFPQLLEPAFASVLPLFDKFLLLLSADMPAVQSTAIALQGLVREGIPTGKINLVVNHLTPYNTVPVSTIQKVLKRQVTTIIPFEPDLVKAVNSGQPLLLSHPQSPASAAIGQLAETLFT